MDTIDRIRSLREDNDINQTEIAKILNVGQKTNKNTIGQCNNPCKIL